MDKISVIVSVYNIEKYIGKCLSSLQNQTYDDFEVLAVDDGSTDQSSKVIKPFLKDSRFRYLKKKNGGLSDARNYGMKQASGKYIAFVDGDDYVEEDYLEKLHQAIQGKSISICEFVRDYPKQVRYNAIREEDVSLFRYPAAWNKLYEKALLDQYHIEFPVGKFYEDLEFTSKVIMVGSYRVLHESLYHYMQNEGSIMHTYDERIFHIYDVFENLTDFAKQQGIYEREKEHLEFASVYHILVGTMYRASFLKNFRRSMVKSIVKHVEESYPKWYNNSYIKDLPISFRVMLFFLRIHAYFLVMILYRLFHNFVRL